MVRRPHISLAIMLGAGFIPFPNTACKHHLHLQFQKTYFPQMLSRQKAIDDHPSLCEEEYNTMSGLSGVRVFSY